MWRIDTICVLHDYDTYNSQNVEIMSINDNICANDGVAEIQHIVKSYTSTRVLLEKFYLKSSTSKVQHENFNVKGNSCKHYDN